MKKIFTLLCSAAFTLGAQTLTQNTHEPTVGETEKVVKLDTSAYNTGLPLNNTGQNTIWDFSLAQPANSNTITNTYDAPSTYTHGTMFAGANIVQNLAGSMFTYYKSSTTPTTQAEIEGIYTSTVALSFTNSALVIQYPVTFGLNISDAVSGTYTMGAFNGPVEGTTETMADGTGTLLLPGGVTYTDVIRVKTVQNYTLTQGPLSGTLRQTVYNYYDVSEKFPIINISYIRLGMGTATPTVIAGMFGTAESFTPVGLSKNNAAFAAKLYPNPASSELLVSWAATTEPSQVEIYDINGRKILSYSPLKTENTSLLDVSSLPEGIYFCRLQTNKVTESRKLVISR